MHNNSIKNILAISFFYGAMILWIQFCLSADDSIKSLYDAKEISKEMKNYFLFHLIYSLERLTRYGIEDGGSEKDCT